MADIMIVGKLYADTQPENNNTPGPTKPYTSSSSVSYQSQVFGLIIGIYAAYLSWTCNTAKGVDTVGKVIYSFFAFIFGGFYLIYYFLVNRPCGSTGSTGVTNSAYYYF